MVLAENGRIGIEKYYEEEPDVILLDLMLPELNGIEVCRRIRKESSVPIIMLTAKGETMDKIAGLDSGADDYVTKPFAIEELFARIRVALRRRSGHSDSGNILAVEDLKIDTAMRKVMKLSLLKENMSFLLIL